MKYSMKASGSVKHINSEDGIVTLCGLEIESMYSAIPFESVHKTLPLCKLCEKKVNSLSTLKKDGETS